MSKFIASMRDVLVATIVIILFHISALVSFLKLIAGKLLEYTFKLLLLIVFVVLLMLSSFKQKYTQSWSDIKRSWADFVDFIYYFDYKDLVQWYKDVFSKEVHKSKIDS